jgi:hypothetical protein
MVGSGHPFERPKLAPWPDGKSYEYDTLIAAKLDGLTRSLFDFADQSSGATSTARSS